MKHIWFVAIVLQRTTPTTGTDTTQTVSWRADVTEDEAKGSACFYALQVKPGFGIILITTQKAQIEIPPS
jgi:hypothetical protein